jgi:hypothetical protein
VAEAGVWLDDADDPSRFRFWDGSRSTDETCPKPAGWLRDPVDAGRLRYWDGERWTDDVQPGGGGDVTQAPLRDARPEPHGKVHQRGREVDAALVAVAGTLGGVVTPKSWRSLWKVGRVRGTVDNADYEVACWSADENGSMSKPARYTFYVSHEWHPVEFNMMPGKPLKDGIVFGKRPVPTGDESFDLVVQTTTDHEDIRNTFTSAQWAMISKVFTGGELPLARLDDKGAAAKHLPARSSAREVVDRAERLVTFFSELIAAR